MLTALYVYLSTYFQDEEGQGMAEYGLILALIAVVVALALPALATAITTTFGDVASSM